MLYIFFSVTSIYNGDYIFTTSIQRLHLSFLSFFFSLGVATQVWKKYIMKGVGREELKLYVACP